jgi:HlyD family secretion protein
VLVKLGDTVDAGQVLAELDDADLQLSVSAAENSLLGAQANFSTLAAGLTTEERKLAEIALQTAAETLQEAQAAYDQVSWRPNISMLPQSTSLEQATKDHEKAKLTCAQTVRGASTDDLAIAQAQAVHSLLSAHCKEAQRPQVERTSSDRFRLQRRKRSQGEFVRPRSAQVGDEVQLIQRGSATSRRAVMSRDRGVIDTVRSTSSA